MKYPIEVGYYWVRYAASGGEPFIVKVNEDKRGNLYADEGIVMAFNNYEWLSGKLQPPVGNADLNDIYKE